MMDTAYAGSRGGGYIVTREFSQLNHVSSVPLRTDTTTIQFSIPRCRCKTT